MKLLREADVRVNDCHDEALEGRRRQWQTGIDFPLVDEIAAALPIAREFGLTPLPRP